MADLRFGKTKGNSGLFFAALSALFAAATSLLAKVGIKNVDSNLATAIRTGVVLILAWLIVFARGETKYVRDLKGKDIVFLILSGLATGASWLCYYYAIQNGQVSVVVPIDKLSILITVVFSVLVFRIFTSRLEPNVLRGLHLFSRFPGKFYKNILCCYNRRFA